jgi:hypothetical protein
MYSYEDPRNAELVKQATEIFGFFTGSSEHMNKEQFRSLFLSSGEEITSEAEFDGLFAEVDGNDRDARISLDEFIEWYKKDDSYEYSARTKPLRDMKERLKNPAFYRSLQYFMGKNPGTSSSNMNSDSSILDIDVGLKVGKVQSPEWGFDLKFETVQSSVGPSIAFEMTYQDGLDFQEISHKLSTLASVGAQMTGMGPAESPSQISIDGRPGIRVNVPLSPMHPVIMMAPMFLSIIKHLHLKLHTSQSIDQLDSDSVKVDAGFKFQGQRSAFQMLSGIAVGQLGMKQQLFTVLSLVNHARFSFGMDSLKDILEGKLSHQTSPQKIAAGKKNLGSAFTAALTNMGLTDIFPMPLKNLHKIQITLGNQQFSFTGINFDISFLFADPVTAFDDPHRLHGNTDSNSALVLYDYSGTSHDELTIVAGERVTIITKSDSGWWTVQGTNGIGMVPANYLQQ